MLAGLAGVVFGVACVYRGAVYLAVRQSGACVYCPKWRRVEEVASYGALLFGGVAGLLVFGHLLVCALCAGAFFLAQTGAVLQALVDNEPRRQDSGFRSCSSR